jgi:hypothetical protein
MPELHNSDVNAVGMSRRKMSAVMSGPKWNLRASQFQSAAIRAKAVARAALRRAIRVNQSLRGLAGRFLAL